MATVYPASERDCRECGQTKPLTEFYPKGSGRHGRTARCKECMRARQRRYTSAVRGLSDDERDGAYERWCARRDDREALALIGQARCPMCKQAKPLGEFYPDPYRRSGRECRCNTCMRARARHYHWDPATPRKGKGQLWLFPLDKKCPRCGSTKPLYHFGWLEDAPYGHGVYCRACNCALTSSYDAIHPEWKPRKRAAVRAKYAANPIFRATVKRRSKEWYAAHPEQSRDAHRAWIAAHPEQYRLQQRRRKLRRRYLLAAVAGRHTAADIRLLRAVQHDRCAYCLGPLTPAYHVDHMTALTRGGSDWPCNLCLTCPRCNCRKQAMNAGQFLALLLKEKRILTRSTVVIPLSPPRTKAKGK